jgi:hypothetical protein
LLKKLQFKYRKRPIFPPIILTITFALAQRRGIVVIGSPYRTEDPGFEPRQDVRFLGLYIAVQWPKLNIPFSVFTGEK